MDGAYDPNQLSPLMSPSSHMDGPQPNMVSPRQLINEMTVKGMKPYNKYKSKAKKKSQITKVSVAVTGSELRPD